ncbi:MAG TPA: hypothetical protein VKS81_08980 [Bacteroidota bacterium]|nr:hypothetical protein [Bacteroidota bacterium]
MGQQQLLLIILGVIIVGVAIAVGISMFSGQSNASNRDGIIADLNSLGADAFQFKIRPVSMGGGAGSFAAYVIPTAWGAGNPNATYTISGAPTTTNISFHAVSKTVTGATVDLSFNGTGGVTAAPVSVGF